MPDSIIDLEISEKHEYPFDFKFSIIEDFPVPGPHDIIILLVSN